MMNYTIIKDLSKKFASNIVSESKWSAVDINQELVSNLAKNQIICDLINQRDSFIEIIDNKIDEIKDSMVDFDDANWIHFKSTEELINNCSYQKEIVIFKNSEKLNLLNNILWKSVSKITIREWNSDYIYLDAFLDWIDNDWENDDLDDTPLLLFLPNFVLSDWWSIELCDNDLLDIYMNNIKEIIFDGVRYKFLNL